MATRNIVPRATGEGGIGTSLKKWLNGWFNNINGKDVSSGVATTSELNAEISSRQSHENSANPHSGSASVTHNHDSTYAPLSNGVTGGNSHDHNGGDGGQIAHSSLSGAGTNSHAAIDTHLSSTSNPHGVTASQTGAIPATTGAATAYVGAATTSAAGKVQLATSTEATTGTDTAKAITPAALAAALLAAIGIDPIDLPRNSDLGTAAYLDQTWLYASATWDAGSVATAAQTSTTVAVPGAEIGDKVMPSASIALSGLNLRGEVTATDVVTIYLSNVTGSSVDLASATYYISVLKRTPAR